jgi:hypothetical protein
MWCRVLRRALVAAPAMLLLAFATAASADPAPSWQPVTTIPANTLLDSVSTAGPGHAWAVGVTAGTSGLAPLIEAWNGSAWSPVTLTPAQIGALGPNPFLTTTSATGLHNVWAFSYEGGWLHRSGSGWSAGWLGNDFVASSLALGSGSAWAFGSRLTTRNRTIPFAAYYAGRKGWITTQVPGSGVIVGASAVSGSDIWAVAGSSALSTLSGNQDLPGGYLLHWHAGHWHTVTNLPAKLRIHALGSVLALSDKDIWVGGAVKNGAGGRTEAVGHWTGHRWTVVTLNAPPTAAPYHVTRLITDGSGGLWALGSCDAAACPGGEASRIWHDADGRWGTPDDPALEANPAVLVSLARVGQSVWGVGLVQLGINNAQGLIAVEGATP